MLYNHTSETHARILWINSELTSLHNATVITKTITLKTVTLITIIITVITITTAIIITIATKISTAINCLLYKYYL